MAWIEGNQIIRNDSIEINKKIKDLEGYLEEDEARYWFIQFLKNNISFAAHLLLGVELFPFQHLTINTFSRTDYSLYIAGRGLSKTWSTAVFAALHALFNQGSKIGVMAPSFRQSKIILEKLEDILKEPEAALYRQVINTRSPVVRGADQWTVEVGRSTIKAVPLGDGSKIRGQRFNCILIDEFLAMPKAIHQEVIMPFISTVENPQERDKLKKAEDALIAVGKMKEEDRYVWPNNKIIAFSSASYKFEYLYEVYDLYDKLIMDSLTKEEREKVKGSHGPRGGATRSIIHFSHEVASPYSLYDSTAVEQARASSSDAQFAREWEAQFTDDSCGFYSMKKLLKCMVPTGESPTVEVVGDKGAKYILSLDPSWSKDPGSDHFAMHVLKLDEKEKRSVLVHSYAVPGRDLKHHVKYFEYLWDNFNFVLIVGDYAGGVSFLDSVNESSIFKKKNIQFGVIDGVDFNDPEKYNEDLQKFKNQYNLETKKMCYLKTSSTRWLRWGNELLQGAFDNRRILFASRAPEGDFRNPAYKDVPVKELKFYPPADDRTYEKDGKQALMLSFLDHQSDILDLTRNECALIEVKSNPAGSQTFDLPQNLRRQSGPNKPRKDSYSALLFGNWGIKIFFDSVNITVEEKDAFFMPMIV
jgi:hypothetical protein